MMREHAKANKTALLFVPVKKELSYIGGIRTHGTLHSRQALYHLSYRGNSGGRGSNLQHKTKANLKRLNVSLLYQSISNVTTLDLSEITYLF